MNIGIFSGSFDPIHVGHLILANYIVEFTDIEEIWFLVTPKNPMKLERQQTDEKLRLEMVQLALSKYSKLKASDFEFSLPRPSYTIHTLEALATEYPEHEFSLIIGADNWAGFEHWKSWEDILKKYTLMVYPRLGSRIAIPSKLRTRVEALDSPIIELSSSYIRECMNEGKDLRAFLPTEVYEYIQENKLYQSI